MPKPRLNRSYNDYINSQAWRDKKAEYSASGRPRKCAVCTSIRYQLHHVTYERFGNELLDDLVPLCKEHHEEAHVFLGLAKKSEHSKAFREWLKDHNSNHHFTKDRPKQPKLTKKQKKRQEKHDFKVRFPKEYARKRAEKLPQHPISPLRKQRLIERGEDKAKGER